MSYKQRWTLNIGVILFGVIFIYLFFAVFTFVTSEHITIYEVREGSILKDVSYTGFVVREETQIKAGEDGYINFYVSNKTKVSVGTNIFALTKSTIESSPVDTEEQKVLSADEEDKILLNAQQFTENFNGENFTEVYALKDDLKTIMGTHENDSRVSQLNEMDPNALHIYATDCDGVVSYVTDGYEGKQTGDVTLEDIHRVEHSEVERKNNTKINKNDSVFKLVTDETWSIVIQLDESAVDDLSEKTRLKVHIPKGDQTLWADFRIEEKEGESFGYLTFEKSMIQYVSDRYLDINLIETDQSGLKVPKTAKVTKSFFAIPSSYLTQGGNTKETGILYKDDKDTTTFKKAEVYFKDEDGYVYLDPEEFKSGMVLVKPDSAETLTLKEKRILDGVYNINKGYAVFKQIEILSESDEYYIVKEGNSYSLSNYDHIALDGSNVKEHDIVYQ